MFDIQQYLGPALIGMLIGIGLVLAFRQPSQHRPRRRRRRRYNRRHGNDDALLVTFIVFLFLTGVIAVASQTKDELPPPPDKIEKREENEPYRIPPEDNQAREEGRPGQYSHGRSIPAGLRINQSPSQGAWKNAPMQETILADNSDSAANIPNREPEPQELMTEEGQNGTNGYQEPGSYYIQTGAGHDKAAALEQLKELRRKLPLMVWLGLKNEALPLKFLLGPFPDKLSAEAARAHWGLKGFVRNADTDDIEVYTLE